MLFDPRLLFAAVLSVSSWLMPQPQYSKGNILVYGNQRLVEANAAYRGYDLSKSPGRCGFASISPAHIGQMAWITVGGKKWIHCLVVDVDGRDDAFDAIWRRGEIGEISFADAAWLGFEHNVNGWRGRPGAIWFGDCLPLPSAVPVLYRPPLVLDTVGEWTPSLYPYPKQELPRDCYRGGP